MKCPYCGTEFDVETLRAYDEELKKAGKDNVSWNSLSGAEWYADEENGLRVYLCNTCGGEVVADENTAATSCPFCGNPVVMMGQFRGELKPDYVIPFQVSREEAVAALKKHYLGKKLLPKVFRDQNHIEEIKGMYVPFWLFDSDLDANIRYKATKMRFWSDSSYRYTETSFYSAVREGQVDFRKVPVDGSSKIADELMESIEPYDFSKAVDFQTAYLSGYFADKYDIGHDTCIARATERTKKSAEDAFMSTVDGYSSVIAENSSINLKSNNVSYALYPVWFLNTKWNGTDYSFAMNGQTGKFVGDLPLDKGAYARWLFGIAGAVSAAIFAIQYLLWLL
jgi:DNA-directed RNA polymerase subunit RPC12/RpoP